MGRATRFRPDAHLRGNMAACLLIMLAAGPGSHCEWKCEIPSGVPPVRPLPPRSSRGFCAPRLQARAARPTMGKKLSVAQLAQLAGARGGRHSPSAACSSPEAQVESPCVVEGAVAQRLSPQVAPRLRLLGVLCAVLLGGLTLPLCVYVAPDFIAMSDRGTLSVVPPCCAHRDHPPPLTPRQVAMPSGPSSGTARRPSPLSSAPTSLAPTRFWARTVIADLVTVTQVEAECTEAAQAAAAAVAGAAATVSRPHRVSTHMQSRS